EGHRRHLPRTWPPASQPWAMTISTLQFTGCLAAAAEPTVCITMAPPAFARGTRDDGSRQKKEMTGTRSSRQAARRSSCGTSRFRLTPNGRNVRARISLISRRTGVDVHTPRHQHTEAAGIADGRGKGRTYRTAHGGLNNWQIDTNPLTQCRF